jgi:NitT/TauT family transport system permease protein
LGSGQWDKAKRKAAQQIRDTAAELLGLYAARAIRKGHAFEFSAHDYAAFSESFGFEETPDQANAIAAVIGISVGLLIATNEFAKHWLQPWISGFYATPTVALGPLFILWLGIGVWSKIVIVVLLVVFAVIINTEAGIRSTSERYLEMMRAFGATPRQLFFKVSLPSATPFILAGLKLGIGRGLIGVVVAELFGSRLGLGRLIGASADSFNMPELFAAVSILAASGIAMNSAFAWLEARLVPWTKD